MRRLWFWASHMVPRRHCSTYGEGGRRYVSVWRQWGARVWDHRRFEVAREAPL